jgi:hypothetical protein
MTQYLDMSTGSLAGIKGCVRKVGWLGIGMCFPQGELAKDVVQRLGEFVKRWRIGIKELGWYFPRGAHRCEFCTCTKFYAAGEFAVPSGKLIYLSPEMILHYVQEHGYRPPERYCQALLESPLPGTEEYRAAVKRFRDASFRRYWPGYFKWKQEHPQFLGVTECLRIHELATTSPDVRMGIDWELYDNAQRCASELSAAYQTSTDAKMRYMLLHIMADAGVAEAVPIFEKCLRSRNPAAECVGIEAFRGVGPPKARRAWVRDIAIRGLRNVNSAESQAVLRKARVDICPSQARGRAVNVRDAKG